MAENGALTRKDLEQCLAVVATKDDLKGFATKDDLERLGIRLSVPITALQAEVERLREQSPTKADFDRFMTGMEKAMGLFDEQQKRFFIQGEEIGRQGDRLDLHERRLDMHQDRLRSLETGKQNPG